MPAVSKKQRRFMGMVHACKTGGKCPSNAVSKAAALMKGKDAEDFASTKEKNLPEKVSENISFKEWLLLN